MIKRGIITGIFSLLFVSMSVSAVNKDDKKKDATVIAEPIQEGIVYSLPRTGVRIIVKATKESFTHGPYWQYAERFLGIPKALSEDKIVWRLTDFRVETFGEADPNAVFKTASSVASLVSVLPDGRIVSVNSKNVNFETKVAGTNFLLQNNDGAYNFNDRSQDDYFDISVNTATGEENSKVKSIEEKAHEAANAIFKIRKRRTFTPLSSTDELPSDGAGYVAMLQATERVENEYVALFVGKTIKSTQEYVFDFVPENGVVKNEVIFRFSETKGVVPKSDISGKPVVVDISKDENMLKKITELAPLNDANAKLSGIYYRIPMVGTLTISDGLTPFFTCRLPFAQLGTIAALPESLLNEKLSVKIDPITGALSGLITKE